MTTTLHLGVIDLPYGNGTKSTGDVAEFLENKYHVMETFYESNKQKVADHLASSFEGALESIVMGRNPAGGELFNEGTSAIEQDFKEFLEQGAIEALGIPGVPTKAATKRKSSRFKKGRNPKSRPSFIDTGLYESSAKAWVDLS